MPDGTSRFKCKGQDILHFMGTSTFSQYTVVADISVVAVQPEAPMDRTCLLGCGITTGYGAARVTANVEEGSSVAIFGAGCVGLSVVQGAVLNKAGKIIVVDVNPTKEEWSKKFGATDFVNPTQLGSQSVVDKLIELTDGGCDYTFDCTGNVSVMRAALEACHKGWGQSIIIGVAAAGQEISTRRKSCQAYSAHLPPPYHFLLGPVSANRMTSQLSNSSPAACGRVPLSAASRAAPSFLVLSTTTCRASSRLTSSSPTARHLMRSTTPLRP